MADEEITKGTDDYPAGALVFQTLPHAGSWTPSSTGETYNDLVVIAKPTKKLIRDAGHAHAAGVIEVLQGLDTSTVQSQEDGEAAYEKAVANGRWHESQAVQAALDAEARERGDYTIVVDEEGDA